MIIPIRLARIRATGKRFIVFSEEKNKIRMKGEVKQVSGFSATHGPDKVFLRTAVDLSGVDLTEELLNELLLESA